MKKKILLLISGFCVLIFGFIFIITNGEGVGQYYSEALQSTIDVPRFAFGIKETEYENTVQLEFIMFGDEPHIIQQLSNLYENPNSNNNNLGGFEFMQWSINDEKLYKHITLVYEQT
ncbi:MAG: hypothetical protein UH241_09450 [Acutalibacteraceae bacterium]|nr:hypothetical protein [Acutalibacteraceae bacterium]